MSKVKITDVHVPGQDPVGVTEWKELIQSRRPRRSFRWPTQSFWKKPAREPWSFYCPHCRAQVKTKFEPKPHTTRRFFQIFLVAAVFTLSTWSLWTWKGMVSFVPFWAVFETFYRLRLRAKVVCHECGFDPFLYLVDVRRARAEIEMFWKKKFEEKGLPYPPPVDRSRDSS